MRRRFLRAAAGFLLVGAGVLTTPAHPGAQADDTTAVAPTLKSQIQYVVIPHPDDESQSWPMIANSSANYPVFILLTHGDHTSHCGLEKQLALYEPEAGELPPVPEPVLGDFAACDAARLNSWHLFLDQMAVRDPYLDVPALVGTLPITVTCTNCSRAQRIPTTTTQDCTLSEETRTPVLTYELYVGVSSARMIFDFGDCDLKASEVAAAIWQARADTAAGLFPLKKEYGIIGAAFWNETVNGCAVYGHDDHYAVHAALRGTNFGTPGPQWGRTTTCDTSTSRSDTLPSAYYQDLLGATATTRPGIMQKTYGWLEEGFWEYAPKDDTGSTAPFWNQTTKHWTVH